ncbi:hypothetical protein LCGC14_0705400 [marine sediment metagenome]|uniref:Uncharacterized protein n=1 Tax=marine sediment metagenome TaxID=412755 RepID=A0A0F9R209_9ZZZZ
MLHSERKNYQKKISKLNKDFPSGFKTIDFRMLPDTIKFQIISNKVAQMETPEFQDICSLLNFTSEDISHEICQLIDYLETLRFKMKNTPIKKKRDKDKITQKELDDLSIKKDLFSQDLSGEYDRLFPLLIDLIKKRSRLNGLRDSRLENSQIVFNLTTVMEADVKSLHNERKELYLKILETTDKNLIRKHQARIKKLVAYIFYYVKHVYKPLLTKHQELKDDQSLKQEQFAFNIIDGINEKMEEIKNKLSSNVKEFYFDDGLELHIMFKNKSSSKYPVRHVRFKDLATNLKKAIIHILKSRL